MNTVVTKIRAATETEPIKIDFLIDAIKQAQLNVLFRTSWICFSGSSFLAILLFMALWQNANSRSLLLWICLILIINIIGAAISWRIKEKFLSCRGYWFNSFLLWAGFNGTLWGVASLYLLPTQPFDHQISAIILLLIVSLASIFLLAPRLEVFLSFSLPLFLLTILRLNTEYNFDLLLLISALLLVALILAIAWQLHYVQKRTFQHKFNDLSNLNFKESKVDEYLPIQASPNINSEAINIVQANADSEKDSPTQVKAAALAIMSHEVRTPISGVLGMLALLRDSPLRPAQREYLETAYSAAESLLTLVNDVLDFSKIEAGKLKLELISFNLRRTIESVVELFAPQARSKNIDLNCIIPWDIPLNVLGDPTRLRQVLINLVSNAIKFTSAGEVTVKVTLQDEKENHVALNFFIRDTGIGIAPEAQQKIFQPFLQADGSISQRFGGTGLGLNISKQLIELMGGNLSVESLPGVGSIFKFSIQLGKVNHAKVVIPESDLNNLKMLIISDEGLSTSALEEVIKRWGMQVDTFLIRTTDALHNQLKIAHDKSTPYDVILFNKRRFDLNSITLIQSLTNSLNHHVIVISETAKRGDGEKARQLSIKAFLTQPVTSSQLRQSVSAVISQQQKLMITRHTLAEVHQEKKHRILVVDDNIVNQKVTVAFLKKLGYQAITASSGWEALEALTKSNYSLILMDVQMPQLDGYETTKKIRSCTNNYSIPVVAITANTTSQVELKCINAGMNAFITKPLNLDNLSSVLEKWLFLNDEKGISAGSNNIH